MSSERCHLCQSSSLQPVPVPQEPFAPVSSDSRIVPGTLAFAVCVACGGLQKILDARWRRDVAQVYGDYVLNYQGGGADPYIFSSPFGAGPRAELLVKFLTEELVLPQKGRLLDIGCGNGNILRAFAARFPEWELYGMENSRHWEKTIKAIAGVKDFFVGNGELEGRQFDIIIMSHVLEHIPEPEATLRQLAGHLNPQGRLLIAVPNIRQNPIDLFVLDHCTHFDDETLPALLLRAGLSAPPLRTDFLGREIIALAATGASGQPVTLHKYAESLDAVCAHYFTLAAGIRDMARKLRDERGSFGIMGTATASIWLTAGLATSPDFYIDEDPSRMGTTLFDKPVYALKDVPQGATVFIPMAKPVAEKIIVRAPKHARMEYLDWNEIDQASKVRAA